MLFNSYEFLLLYLPAVLLCVYLSSSFGYRKLAKATLFVASLVFYAWWDPPYVLLLLALLVVNFAIGTRLIATTANPSRGRTLLFVVGLTLNIGTLMYYKYTGFLLHELSDLLNVDLSIPAIVLPLGLSFIVFQKIAFLVDSYSGQIERLTFVDYGLFVSFFPQLISGPIVHHREVIPQFDGRHGLRYVRRVIPIAITFLAIGGFKKVVIADNLSSHVAIFFKAAAAGQAHGLLASWFGTVTFTLQVYFDFSGYSDMAIGLGLLFGIRLPFNFNSPLKSASIIDFWTRWHITLTRFLTAYIYNPILLHLSRRRLAAKKKITVKGVMGWGAFAQLLAVPTLVTMFIAGAWHGAGFQFMTFGLIHAVYLIINHGWRNFRKHRQPKKAVGTTTKPSHILIARTVTFVAIVISIPFFRADSIHTASSIIAGMIGRHGVAHGDSPFINPPFLALVVATFLLSQIAPNTQEIMHEQLDASTDPLVAHAGALSPSQPSWSWPRLRWRPTTVYAILLGLIGWIVMMSLAAPTEFLYYQF